jgi:large-conductance mechanosensitive channel
MHGFAMRCIDQLRKELKMSNPTRTGAALAATVAIGYAACTLVFWLWPEAAASFMNTLFHGLDFRKLQSGPALFNFGSFVYALVGITIWAFGLGALFGWLSGRIQR